MAAGTDLVGEGLENSGKEGDQEGFSCLSYRLLELDDALQRCSDLGCLLALDASAKLLGFRDAVLAFGRGQGTKTHVKRCLGPASEYLRICASCRRL
jgi:hypothetical protein